MPKPSSVSGGRVTLLGVPIDAFSMDEAVRRLRQLIESQRQHQVATPNSEMLVESAKNPEFRRVLCASSLNLPDSAGLLWMARLTGQYLPARVTGTDSFQRLCAELGPDHPVFLLGGAPGVAQKAADVLKSRNSRLKVAGTFAGTPSDEDAPEIVARINASCASVLFVAFGAPKQELWIAKHLSSFTSVRLAMGIGGAFDFVAGKRKRAPRILQAAGLEWAWRLFFEPQRFRRIWNAVVVFPSLVLRYGKEAPGG